MEDQTRCAAGVRHGNARVEGLHRVLRKRSVIRTRGSYEHAGTSRPKPATAAAVVTRARPRLGPWYRGPDSGDVGGFLYARATTNYTIVIIIIRPRGGGGGHYHYHGNAACRFVIPLDNNFSR